MSYLREEFLEASVNFHTLSDLLAFIHAPFQSSHWALRSTITMREESVTHPEGAC